VRPDSETTPGPEDDFSETVEENTNLKNLKNKNNHVKIVGNVVVLLYST
jgi:hypothetical protein